ncbi:hypothetical protein P885DRAFT_59219 [Corynascus similis CBS 632.67]
MLLTTLFSFAAWIVPTFASPDIDNMRVGQSEFRMGAILSRQQDQGQTNLQVFSGALGGAGAPAITNSGDPDRPFQVEGDTFPDYESAANRACDNQKNACADVVNNGSGASFEVGDCDLQNGETVRAIYPIFLFKCGRHTDISCYMEEEEKADDRVCLFAEQCKSEASSAAVKAFPSSAPVLVGSDADFDFFCEV